MIIYGTNNIKKHQTLKTFLLQNTVNERKDEMKMLTVQV